jgi:hypothetical protein
LNTFITVLNYATNLEKEFALPFDYEELEEFVDFGENEYKITDVEDSYNFLMKIRAYEDSYKFINSLVEKIENTSNIEETIFKLSYHCELNDYDINYMIDNFDNILEKYEVYENFSRVEDWAQVYNDTYNFIDTNDANTLYRYFDNDLEEAYFRDLTATFDLGEWEEKIYEVGFDKAFEFLKENNLLLAPSLSIVGYLDWKKIVQNLRASAFYIDTFDKKVIVHYG